MKLLPSFDKFTRSKISGNTVNCTSTFNPTIIGGQDTLYIKIPKLEVGNCLIPSSLKLTAKLKNKNTKSWFLNNISALLQWDIKVRFGKSNSLFDMMICFLYIELFQDSTHAPVI